MTKQLALPSSFPKSLLDDDKPFFGMIAYCLYAAFSICVSFGIALIYAARKCGALPIFGCLGLLLLLAVIFVRMVTIHSRRSDYLFLLVGVPAGIAFCLFILPGNVPDEYPHIWQIAALFSRSADGFMVPNALSEANMPHSFADMYGLLTSAPGWGNEFLCGRYLSGYFTHVYLISSIPMALCRLLGVNEYVAVYLARLANLTTYLACAFILIRFANFGKRLLLVYFLNPILIQQEASCSADAITNLALLSFVVVALTIYAEKAITKRRGACLGILTILLCLSKSFAYVPLLLMFLLFVPRKLGNWSRRGVWLSVFAAGTVAAILVVVFYRGSFMEMGFELLRSPLTFAKVMLKTVWEMGPFWTESFAGYNLGALSINVWKPCFWAYLVLLFVVSCDGQEESGCPLCLDDRLLLWIIPVIDTVLICLSMREWTVLVDGRSDIFMGVQGRYLIPLVVLPLLAMLKRKDGRVEPSAQMIPVFILAAIYFVDMICIIQFF